MNTTYTITLYSTALFSTWINVEELSLLIDAGDGVSAGLTQKSGKIKHVFVTHPDRDHILGLPQLLQLNSRPNFPKVYYPQDSGSFPAMHAFLTKFDPHVAHSEWTAIKDGDVLPIKKGFEVEALRNEHINSPIGVHKSLSYKVYEVKHKLKPAFAGMSGAEIGAIAKEKGRDFISEQVRSNILSFSGDTPVDDYGKWDGSQVLVHEATFLDGEEDLKIESKKNKHSRIDEVLKMVKEIEVGSLVLTHFSTRYSREDIDQSVKALIRDLEIKTPIYLVYPGEIKRNILASEPING